MKEFIERLLAYAKTVGRDVCLRRDGAIMTYDGSYHRIDQDKLIADLAKDNQRLCHERLLRELDCHLCKRGRDNSLSDAIDESRRALAGSEGVA